MSRIKFSVNGVGHSVGCEVSSDVMLVDYLRNHLELRGTKYMCREGGCGACCVSVRKCADGPVESVNSCLVSVMSCQDWEITTIEEIGNRKKGYHKLQETLAEHNGTQCGYCSPGWVVNMYSLLQNENKPTMLDIEKSLNSNICRCTGYRPILEAFKTFGSDATNKSIMDIEDLKICKKTSAACNKNNCEEDDDWCVLSEEDVKGSNVIEIELQDKKMWYKVYNLNSIFDILNKRGTDSYMLVYGNSAKGINPILEYPNVMIDITSVPELKSFTFDQNLIVGAGISITELTDIFKDVAQKDYFEYLTKFVEHIHLVASIPVKNLGSVGGNLMIKNQHPDFASDLYVLFETVGAYVTIRKLKCLKPEKLSMPEFLRTDMKGKVIVNIILPPLNNQYKLVTYKVMPRSQTAPATVNAGFLYKLDSNDTVETARIAYGGLSAAFNRANATEKYLQGKTLFSNATLQGALATLEGELQVTEDPGKASAAHRKQLALSLFYKGLLSICPKETLKASYVSGRTYIHNTRPVSSGNQKYPTDPTLYPLNEPINKVDGLIQCAGEAQYTDDLQVQPGEVHAAFALSTVAVGEIDKIDASEALKQPGVLAFYTAADIPGTNTFITADQSFYRGDEVVLADGTIHYFNQPIGIIVAESHHIAVRAANLVTATYKNVKKPVIDIKATINDSSRVTPMSNKPQTEKGTDVAKTIQGKDTIYGQVHFTMEGLCCVTRPTEEGLELHLATQAIDNGQVVVSRALKIPSNKIDVHARRIGGGLGLKLTRSNQIAIVCSLVAMKLNRPCRFVLPFTTCTKAIGKRLPCHSDYEVDVNSAGVIQSNKYKLYSDNGYMLNELLSVVGFDVMNNCYTDTKWDCELYDVTTDTAKNTWCRSPGTLESISLAENLMERISYELSLDPIDVRVANVDTKQYNDLITMIEKLKTSARYTERKADVEKFNKENRWKKRGLRCSFVRWNPFGATMFYVHLAICHADGTVIITHGGIEMGQGINTKAVQICAYLFNISVDKVQIKANSSIIGANSNSTGGSLGSQNIGLGVGRACNEMLQRLAPIRAQLGSPTWQELITTAYNSNIELQAHSYVGLTDVLNFSVYGVSLCEVEVDILTGESEFLQADILQDAGQSVSPEIDIGQIEGAFIMGLGYWTSEDLKYNKATGEFLSNSSLSYYVPMVRDIPQVFNVTLRENSYSFDSIFGAKVTGEPPMCLSIVIAFAIREAIAAARKDVGLPVWFTNDGPFTVEKINLACGLRKEDFLFN